MIIKSLKDPFPHIIIDKFFNDEEFKEVFEEILSHKDKFKGPEETGASVNEGVYSKKGTGVFVDNIYAQERFRSKILTYYTRIFNTEMRAVISDQDQNILFKYYYFNSNKDWTLVQAYDNGDYYKPHADNTIFSSVLLMHSTPKKYSGGELVFPTFNYDPKLENNQVIIFPSPITHEVLPVTKKSKKFEDNRFTLSKFISIDKAMK